MKTKLGRPIEFKKGSKRVNLHLTPAQDKQLRKLAKIKNISISFILRDALDQYLVQNG